MKLLIDAGNTRIKWALVNGVAWLCSSDLPARQAQQLPGEIAGMLATLHPAVNLSEVRQIWVSNVAGAEAARHIRDIAKPVEPHFVVAQALQCGVRNGYADVAQLGSDRWAALLAAWHLVQGECLVVNSGTATTIDALSAQGEFLGGVILPGVELMRHSLVAATDQLKSEPGSYVHYPRSSADALYSGAIQAGCGAIERQYALFGNRRAQLLLSGGAAAQLLPQLDQNLFVTPPRIIDNLVLQGLLVMAGETNVK